MTIKAGDTIPSAQLMIETENGPTPVDSADLLGQGRVVLFSVPGPFTPTCSAEHLPSFLEHKADLKSRGVDQIVCMAVSDIFVMSAWAKASGVDGAILMAADGNGEFTRALGLEMDGSAFGLGMRSQRFAMIVENGVVKETFVDAGGEYRVSSAEYVLEHLA